MASIPTPEKLLRIQETLHWIYDSSPFFRHKLHEAGIRPIDIQSFDDFRRIPITRKPELVENQRRNPPFGDFLAVPRSEVTSFGISPGLTYVPRGLADAEAGGPMFAMFEKMGIRRGEDVIHVTLTYHIMPAGLGFHLAFMFYGCPVIPGGPGNTELQVQIAKDLGATVYVGTPSFFSRLGEAARHMGLDPRRDLHYRLALSTADPLTPQLRRELGDTFGVEIFNFCGEAQFGQLGIECQEHKGMHLMDEHAYVEVLNMETGEPVGPGEVGELVGTHLGKRSMPLVRYAPGDGYQLLAGPCPCGNPAPLVDFVGQTGTIRKVKGVLVHPRQVYEVTSRYPELSRFQVHIDRPEGSRYDTIEIWVGYKRPPGDAQGLARKLQESLRSHIFLEVPVILVREEEIPEEAGPPFFEKAMIDSRHLEGFRYQRQ